MQLKNIKICESVKSDHKSVLLKSNQEKEIKFGPGYYKFNNSLLKDKTFVTKMTNLINEKKKEHQNIADKQILWDLLKFEIQSFAMKYSKQKAKIRNNL